MRWNRVINSRREEIAEAANDILATAREAGLDEAACFAIRLAAEEALSNACKHGNEEVPDRKIAIHVQVDGRQVTVTVEDEGRGFDPEAIPDPRADENLRIPSGRGLMLIRSFMHEVKIPHPGNRIEMVYDADAGRPSESSDP